MFTKNYILALLIIFEISCTHSNAISNNTQLFSEFIKQARAIENEDFPRDIRETKAQLFLNKNYSELSELKPANWSESRILFDGLRKIIFYLKDERFNVILEHLYWQLQKENFAKESDREAVYDYFSRSRQFEKARLFLSKLPKWQSKEFVDPPTLISNSKGLKQPQLLNINEKYLITLEKFPLEVYTGLIIVGSPHCGWTKRAIKSILKQQNKEPATFSRITLITPQEAIDMGEIVTWNKLNPKIPYKPVYKESEFKGFSFSTVPSFYFLKNGKIVKNFVGWPDNKRLSLLKGGFDLIRTSK